MGWLPDRSKVVLRYVLEGHAEKQPKSKCVLFEDGECWAYGEALQEAYKAANSLSDFGIKRDENVLIFLPNGPEWIQALWGVSFLGAVMVPVNTSFKGEMLKHVCQDSQATHIITSPDLTEQIKDVGLNLQIIDPTVLGQGSSNKPELSEPIEPWDICMIMYTSGTTGPSKGVILPYFWAYKGFTVCHGNPTSDDTALCDLPLFHMASWNLAYCLWCAGGSIAVRKGFSATRYWDIVRECGVTIVNMIGTIPAFLASTPPKPNDADNPLRAAYCAPMVSDPSAFKARFGIEHLETGFGMTETGPSHGNDDPSKKPKSVGKPRPGVEVRLVDDHDIPVAVGEIGELIQRTELPWVMNVGYWRRPEETAQAWRNGWFHTGDFFYCDEEGDYAFVDRKKDAIRRRGENISSFEVEREVMAYPDVREAACVAAPGEFGEDEVKVFVIPREALAFDPSELIRFLIPRMPFFMIPRYVEVVSEFPKTGSMRVKKYELRSRGNSDATWDREIAGVATK